VARAAAAEVELQPAFWDELAGRMRAARLTFGDRVHCPFLRPLFLAPEDVARVTRVAEVLWRIGERDRRRGTVPSGLLDALALTDDERSLVAIDPGVRRGEHGVAPRRLPPARLPRLRRVQRRVARRPRLHRAPGRAVRRPAGDGALQEQFSVSPYDPAPALLEALLASYREWGGTADAATMLIVDYRGVPTWSEFEILAARFEALGVPTSWPIPATSPSTAARSWRRIAASTWSTGGCSSTTSWRSPRSARPRRRVSARRRLHGEHVPLQDPAQESVLRRAHRRRPRAPVHARRARADPRARAVDAGAGGDAHDRRRRSIDLLEHVRRHRDEFVIKPNDEYGGTGVMLGWEASEAAWTPPSSEPCRVPKGHGSCSDASPCVVRCSRWSSRRTVSMREMLVDLAPYLFRGRVAGFLTRLSSTGLANVTSGGGQVPSFVVSPLGS
jgi:hypothetical protein